MQLCAPLLRCYASKLAAEILYVLACGQSEDTGLLLQLDSETESEGWVQTCEETSVEVAGENCDLVKSVDWDMARLLSYRNELSCYA